MIKIAMIGTGNMARAHVFAALKAGVKPVAAFNPTRSPSALSFEKTFPAIRMFHNLDQFLDFSSRQAKGFLCASPVDNLKEYAQILSRVMPTFVEKPLFSPGQDLSFIGDEKMVRVGYNRRLFTSVIETKKLMSQTTIDGQFMRWSEGCGTIQSGCLKEKIQTNGVHMVDLALHLNQGLNYNSSATLTKVLSRPGITSARLDLSSGASVFLTVFASAPLNHVFEVHQNDYLLRLSPVEQLTILRGLDTQKTPQGKTYTPKVERTIVEQGSVGNKPGLLLQVEEFAKFIEGGGCALPTVEEARWVASLSRQLADFCE